MTTLLLMIALAPTGLVVARRAPGALALATACLVVPGTALMVGYPPALALAAGLLIGGAIRLLVALRAGSGDEISRAQARAEAAVEELAGKPGGALHEDLAIGALLEAIGASNPQEQLAGFRQAEQLARRGQQALTAAKA